MKKYNMKAIIVALLVLLAGFAFVIADIYWIKTNSNVWISIGCSLVASAMVILLNTFLVDAQIVDPLQLWKLVKVVSTRAEINSDCSLNMKKAKDHVDIIAFGLQSFRNTQSSEVEECLKKGVNFRILTMDPNSQFVTARENEEDDCNIKNSIEKLIEWANRLNDKTYRGKIIVKGYNSMTLDFYWRVDNCIYVGPYWYGYDSQQTITYKFIKGGTGFDLYSSYFDKLWMSEKLSTPLTNKKQLKTK